MSNVFSNSSETDSTLHLTEEDVVRRTLLDLLSPVTLASNDKDHAEQQKKKKFRMKQCGTDEGSRSRDAASRPIRVSVIERLSSLTVSVCWSDPRLGRQDDEVWRLGRARSRSRCLLTGKAIQHGDWIFRPRVERDYLWADRDRVILASAVDEHTQHDLELAME
jgi:hypothetical protein